MKHLITLIALLHSITLFAHPQETTHPKNAKEFLQFYRNHLVEGGSGGVGNGGLDVCIDFFKQAVVGLRYLALTQHLTDEQMNQITTAMDRPTQVLPVDFQLCHNDTDTTCPDEQAFVAKNYPLERLILLDIRDLPHKWRQLSLISKRIISVHEFAGLSGQEVGNYQISSGIDEHSGIDDPTLFREFKTTNEVQRYFSLLNDLYFKLPGASTEAFDGTWKKKTVLIPTQYAHIQNEDHLPGMFDSFTFHTDHTFSFLSSQQSGDKIQGPRLLKLKVTHGELVGEQTNELSRNLWRGKVKRIFAPTFPTHLTRHDQIPTLSCKALSGNELLCRMIFWEKISIGLTAFPMHYHYAFYRKQSAKTAN